MGKTLYPYSKKIAEEIRTGIFAGLKMAVIYDSLLRLPNTPRSKTQFFEKYKDDIAKARADYQSYLGNMANERMEAGSDKILELALRSKAGWNPSVKIEEADEEDSEETTALEKLAMLLKVQEDKDSDET